MTRSLLCSLSFFVATLVLPARDLLYESFEGDGFGEWTVEGEAFGQAPSAGGPGRLAGKIRGYVGESFACSFHGGEQAQGTLLSPPFTVSSPYCAFLLAGGHHRENTALEFLIEGQVVESASGRNDLLMRPHTWDVRKHLGKTARLRLVDQHNGPWGFIMADHLLFTDSPDPQFPQITKEPPPEELRLVPAQLLKELLIPEGATAQLFADHSQGGVTSPTALCFDEQGRMLVTETHRFGFKRGVEDNRRHLYWIMDDLAAQTVIDRKRMHEKWDHRTSIEDLSKHSERIRLLSDQDGDGIAEKSTIYAEGFSDLLDGTAAGIFSFEGTTYFACIPHIWTLRDLDQDGRSDERSSLQDGFGVRVSFSGHDLNGFALGPDGRLYGTMGDRGMNVVTKENRHFPYPDQGCIFRFDPDGRNFEVLHTGLRNPKEIAFDQWGNALSVDNNSDQGDKARLIHVIEGADSGWRMGHQILHSFHTTVGLHKRPVNQWMQEKQWAPRNEAQPAWILPPIANITSGPSGLAYHPGTGFSLGCKDRFLICDYKGGSASSGLWSFGVEPEGAGLKLTALTKFNWGVAATDVEFGYDGRIYIADFGGGWKTHQAGRIYSLSSGEEQEANVSSVQSLMRSPFRDREAKQLAVLMDHPDLRIRTRAHLALAEKPEAFATFRSIIEQSPSPLHRLHATWGLWVLARKHQDREATALLLTLLQDSDPEVRAQAARALGEAPLQDSTALRQALSDPSLRVRSFAALSLARLKDRQSHQDVLTLLVDNADQDLTLRHAGVMALLGCSTATEISALQHHPHPSIRLAAVLALRRLAHPALLDFLQDENLLIRDEAIRAIHDLPLEEGRPQLARLLNNYAMDGRGRPLTRMQMQRLLHSAFRFGTPQCAQSLLRTAQNDRLRMDERLEALRLLSVWTEPPAVDHSLGRIIPLAPRSLEDIRPFLEQELHTLLQLEDPIIAAAMALVARYQLSPELISSETLTRVSLSSSRSTSTRTQALDLLVQRQPDTLHKLLTKLTTDSDGTLAAHALDHLIAIDPTGSLPAVQQALTQGSMEKRQKAWRLLSTLNTPAAATVIAQGLKDLATGSLPPQLALEVLEAGETRQETEVQTALKHYQASLDSEDPLAPWQSALAGGHPERGKKIFFSNPTTQCARCHRVSTGHTAEGEAGPNLLGIGATRSPRDLLESLVIPSAQIAPGFGMTTVTFTNNGTLTGTILTESEETLDLLVGEDAWRVRKTDLRERTRPVSPMPSVHSLLSRSEIRDVVSWLSSLKKPSPNTTAPLQAKPFDPSTLQPSEAAASSSPPLSSSDPALMKLGQQSYILCMACHGPQGEGVPQVGPPLAGSEWVQGPAENLIRIQLRGLTGPIKVRGTTYNFATPMPAQAFQNDEQIAAVLTYIRNSFGNQAPPVSKEQVAQLRAVEVTAPPQPALTVDDLISPFPPQKEPSPSPKPRLEDAGSPWTALGTLLVLAWTGLCLAPVLLSLKNR